MYAIGISYKTPFRRAGHILVCLVFCYSISYVVTALFRVLEMHDFIRVTALLEYFEWTPSKQHSRSKG